MTGMYRDWLLRVISSSSSLSLHAQSLISKPSDNIWRLNFMFAFFFWSEKTLSNDENYDRNSKKHSKNSNKFNDDKAVTKE